MAPDPDLELTEMSDEECLQTLSEHCVGRLGIIADDEPVILPVNYAFDGKAVVFRTGYGLKLKSAPQRRVAFEVDRVDESTGTGWSVLVRGSPARSPGRLTAGPRRYVAFPSRPSPLGRRAPQSRSSPRR